MIDQSQEKPRRRKKISWQLLYILATLIVLLILGGSDAQLAALFSGGLPIQRLWLVLCALAMIGFWLFQTFSYQYIARIVEAKTSLWTSLRITLLGEYYSAITPFASGGQPMQVGYYRRYGVTAAKAAMIIAVRYVGYISAICICYIVSVAVSGARILAEFPLVFWLTAAGFLVNFASIVMVAGLLWRPSLVERAGMWVIRLWTCFKPFASKREKWEHSFRGGMQEFSLAAQCIRANPLRCLVAMAIMLISVFCMFSVAYLVYRALGLTQNHYFELFAMQLFLYLATSFAPTPGATGATEGGFYLFFAMVFPQGLLYSAMLVWRLFTYYSHLLIGGVLVVLDELLTMRRKKAAGALYTEETEAMDSTAPVQAQEDATAAPDRADAQQDADV
ncbi:MAG: lysylphosphatidylglycerol synthase transmembrane domain-containing protein [Candidatus Limiplasma sp.]|nr:lysylphosphatidylglycerol synthase transmembrane domain-containing protein [Candidatus Limiplasma sp.]